MKSLQVSSKFIMIWVLKCCNMHLMAIMFAYLLMVKLALESHTR